MIDYSCEKPEICVIGRTNFKSGIGALAYAACELLSRYFPVAIYSTSKSKKGQVKLPNGKFIPLCRDLSKFKVFFFTDVIWNGEYDHNYELVPEYGLRIAHFAYDSDVLPPKWVEILNSRFDVAYVTGAHLIKVARDSGVTIPMGTLPLGLDLAGLLCLDPQFHKKLRFGCVAAFHPRKGMDILVEAFIQEFGNDKNVELLIHSNVAMGDVYEKITRSIEEQQIKNIIISHQNLGEEAKNKLVETFDIFVNCSRGEGYSIGPREALALGKVLVVSDLGPHRDVLGVPGTYSIPATVPVSALYPEIDNQVFGYQYGVTVEDTRAKLREAYEGFEASTSIESIRRRRERAGEFSFRKLALDYARTVVPDIANFKQSVPSSSFTDIPQDCLDAARKKTGAFGSGLSAINRYVLPAHDGGFFSVFNGFMSYLAWEQKEDRCHMVLPDWDVGRLLEKGKKLISFCYGKPEDGNLWLKFFEPPYGVSAQQMNDKDFLYGKSSLPPTIWNQQREPTLTYVGAYELYQSASFKAFRRQYHQAFKEHVHLLPELQGEIDAFSRQHFEGKFMLAAHVKHPSHLIEQPGKCIAHGQAYIDQIRQKVEEAGYSLEDDDWGVFLATDQDRVVAQFKEAFGNRLACYEDVRRTRVSEDEYYDQLSENEKAQEGFQVQHLVAANPDEWNSRMAWEVIRDAMTLARCRVLFHVVSNVSTAVSYMNPEVELVFVE